MTRPIFWNHLPDESSRAQVRCGSLHAKHPWVKGKSSRVGTPWEMKLHRLSVTNRNCRNCALWQQNRVTWHSKLKLEAGMKSEEAVEKCWEDFVLKTVLSV